MRLPAPLRAEADQDHVTFPHHHVERGWFSFDFFRADQKAAAQRAAIGDVACQDAALKAGLGFEYLGSLEQHFGLARQAGVTRMLFKLNPQLRPNRKILRSAGRRRYFSQAD
jgi:hypothetical protein